ANGDTVLIADGTYNEHDLDLGTKNLVLRSQSNNPAACNLDCQQAGQGLRIGGGQDARTMGRGVNIRNSNVSTNHNSGGMYTRNESPNIADCIFSGNMETYSGGGLTGNAVYVDLSSNPTLMGCTFQNNVMFENPSVNTTVFLAGSGTTTMTSCTFSSNSVGV